MKAFHFRLDQALRWRAAQVAIERSRVANAAKELARIRQEMEARYSELRAGAAQVAAGATGSGLTAWAAYSGRSRRQIADLEKTALEAERALAGATELLVQADQKLRLLDNLKDAELERWQHDFDHELEAFASEAFLVRLQSRVRTGA